MSASFFFLSQTPHAYAPVDDKDDAGVRVHEVDAAADLRGRRRRKDLARHGAREHAATNHTSVARLMPCAPAGHDGDLVGRVSAVIDDLVRGIADRVEEKESAKMNVSDNDTMQADCRCSTILTSGAPG